MAAAEACAAAAALLGGSPSSRCRRKRTANSMKITGNYVSSQSPSATSGSAVSTAASPVVPTQLFDISSDAGDVDAVSMGCGKDHQTSDVQPPSSRSLRGSEASLPSVAPESKSDECISLPAPSSRHGTLGLSDQRMFQQFENLVMKKSSSTSSPATVLKASTCSHGPGDECIFCKDYDALCRD